MNLDYPKQDGLFYVDTSFRKIKGTHFAVDIVDKT